ncbi:uncharacterized protein [Nicotiana sylvestris]|uniref:uncharacterized protein n=1 Tax=Nicotiana sylvestris TaxID=4096 RepID=UPI00388CA856
MAASSSPQPLAVGERNSTYASLLENKKSGQVPPKIELKQVEFVHGEATIKFTMEEVHQYAKEEVLHQALVIKFSQDQYDIQDIRKMLPKHFGTQGRCLVGWLARRHVLIRFDRHDDYILAAAKSVNYLVAIGQELQMRIFPWTITSNHKEETSKAFVWISFPNLPPMLFAKQSLLSIASAAGKPLAIDKATQEKSRPSTTRVKVELDLLGKLPQILRIKFVDEKFGMVIEHLQKFVYDNLPLYCICSKRQGHDINTCRLISTNNRDSGLNGDIEEVDDPTIVKKISRRFETDAQ